MITKYLIGGLALLALALGGLAWHQSGSVEALRDKNAALTASIMSYEQERELAREAQAVAEARVKAIEAKAKEYDELREDILRNGQDAILPDWLRSVVLSLRSDPDR